MSDVVIHAEGLGKKYIIGHEAQKESYTALRDVIARGVRTFGRKANDMMHGRAVIEGDELEEVWALRDLNFEVTRGEVVGIIGRNGAGKSTLLKILSRITEPTTGRVRIRGRVASLLEVGTGFHPELTGSENIFLNGAILGMKREEIRRKFDEIVAFAEVDKYLDTPVKRYSSGMYVRLAFAVAAHLEPEILIVDEVLAVGDAAFQKKCVGKMRDVAAAGERTVLVVSHNRSVIETLCTSGILLERGTAITAGSVDSVYRQYGHELGKGAATARVSTSKLQWDQLANFAELQQLKCSDSVCLRFRVRTGSQLIEGIEFDCALVNEQGTQVTNAYSRFLGRRYRLEANRLYEVVISFPAPHLSPGGYTAILYANDDTGAILWLEDIEACRVIALSDAFPHAPVLGGVRSTTLPPFTIDIQ